MKYKIGVFGSGVTVDSSIHEKAHAIGSELGKRGVIVVTGGCSGLPYEAATAARQVGADIWGYTPARNKEEQGKFFPNDDISLYTKLTFVPQHFEFADNKLVAMKYRNVISTAHCDAGIIISGRWGSLNEFTNLYDMGKVIGVLTGTGGVADELENLSKKISKKSKAVILFDSSPEKLVEKILNELKNKV